MGQEIDHRSEAAGSTGTEVRLAQIPQIPNLVETIADNHLKVVPVKDDKGEVTGYDINSRGGHQLFRISTDDMTFAVVKDTILNAAADSEEVAGAFDIIEGVQRSLKKIGMPQDQIPRTPHDIAEQVITLMEDFQRIQQAKSEIDLQNNLQAFLGMSERAFAGGKAEWKKLAPAQQRLVMVFGDTLLVRALEQLEVGEGTIATSEAIKQIAENLSEMRREASWYTGARKAVVNLGRSIKGEILGDETKGLLPALVGVVDEATGKGIERTAEVVGRAKTGLTSRWKNRE